MNDEARQIGPHGDLSGNATAVRVKDVTKYYGGAIALDHLQFSIPKGITLAVFGPNGAGKSTLLRILSGLVRPSSGSLHFEDAKDELHHRARIGYLGHELMLYGKLSAEENLRFFAGLYGLDDIENRARRALEAVELGRRAGDLVRSFSRGMRQRLAIARATLHDPELILLDEPYTGLDPVAAQRATEHFRTLQKAGRTLVVVTHDLAQGLELADRTLVLNHGRIVLVRDERVSDMEAFRRAYFDTVSGVRP